MREDGNDPGVKGTGLRKAFCFLLLCLLVFPATAIPRFNVAAQSDPPPFGEGDWVISDDTVIKDDSLRITGNITILAGASLTLENTTLLLHMDFYYTYRFIVQSNASLYVLNGSYIGADEEGYALYAEPDSTLRIRNSTISDLRAVAIGSWDAVIEDSTILYTYWGIVVWGGHVVIKRSHFEACTSGIFVSYGDAKVYDSYFYNNLVSMKAYAVDPPSKWPELGFWEPNWSGPVGDEALGPRDLLAVNNTITNSVSEGILIWGISAFGIETRAMIKNNIITKTNGIGIRIINGHADVIDNEISFQPYGIFARAMWLDSAIFVGWGQASLNVVNNNFTHCYGYNTDEYGVFYEDDEHITGSWTVTGESTIDSKIRSRANITVKSGGHLTIKDTVVKLLPDKNLDVGIIVEDGGNLTIEESLIHSPGTMNDDIFLEALDGSTVSIRNSTIDGVGYDTGVTSRMGLFTSGVMDIEGTTIKNAFKGLISSGNGLATVHDSVFKNLDEALVSEGGDLEVHDSNITQITNFDVNVNGGTVDLYNTPIGKSDYLFTSGELNVYWASDVMTMWQNREPISNVTIEIGELGIGPVIMDTTGQDGLSDMYMLKEFTHSDLGKSFRTPHSFKGTFLGLINSTFANIDENQRVELFLQDNITPSINVTSPGLVVHQVNNTLVVNGTAADNESGLAKVQWSLDQDLWNDVNGLDIWNFTIILPFGSTEIYLRAVDKAGNDRTLVVTATIDKDPPPLLVLSPIDGFITPLRTVLVEGLVEYGATVTVGNTSVVCLDGTFRFSVPIEEGENLILVTAIDETGNTNSTFVRVIRDSTPPEIVVTYPADNYVTNKLDDQNLPIMGYTEPGAKLMLNGKLLTLGANGSFSLTIGLVEGINVITIVAEDEVGNQNSTVRRVVFDRTVPRLTIISPRDLSFTNLITVTVKGMAEPDANITATDQNHTAYSKANKEGWFELEIGLDEGTNTVIVIARDEAGNSKEDSVVVERDTTPPNITLFNFYDGKIVDGVAYLLEGETEPGARLKIDGEIVRPGRTGKFSKDIPLPSANNTVVLDVVDRAGNKETKTIFILRKPKEDDKPKSTSLLPDYFPWALIVAIVVICIQGVLLTRYSQKQALRAQRAADVEAMSADMDEEEGLRRDIEDDGADPGRKVRRRQARTPDVEEDLEDEYDDEEEFEIEYGGDGR